MDSSLKSPELPLHRTKIAVREVADAELTYDSNPIAISDQEFDALLESLKQASSSFTTAVKEQIPELAQNLFEVSIPSPEQTIMAVFSHRDFGRIKGNLIKDGEAMEMIERALKLDTPEIRLFCTGFPMKVFNPLETNYQGDLVDLSDVSVLLRFAELAEVLTHFGSKIGKKFSVVVVSDGRMNNGMFKVDAEICDSYVAKINAMINKLDIASFVSVQEFFSLLEEHEDRRGKYERTVEKIKEECHEKFDDLLNLDNLGESLHSALEREQRDYHGSSFADLFSSTIGSVRYEGIEELSKAFDVSFLKTYSMILESILWDEPIEQAKLYEQLSIGLPEQVGVDFLEKVKQERSATLEKAWHSTIEYFAILEVSKETQILNSFFPDGIRITTRPKKGQIGIHTSDQNSPTLFSYHSVPVILPSNKGKNVKVDFQLRFHALRNGYCPMALNDTDIICYVHPEVASLSIEQLPWIRGSNRGKKLEKDI